MRLCKRGVQSHNDLQQTIRFTRSVDGVRLAYAKSGTGPPLVKSANWLSHLEFDWQSPVWRHWFRFLSSRPAADPLRSARLRSVGLGRDGIFRTTHRSPTWRRSLRRRTLDRFPLLGLSQGGAACIEYAVRHPERVTQLVLYGVLRRGLGAARRENRRQARRSTS